MRPQPAVIRIGDKLVLDNLETAALTHTSVAHNGHFSRLRRHSCVKGCSVVHMSRSQHTWGPGVRLRWPETQVQVRGLFWWL